MEFGFDPLKQSICQSVGDFFLSNLTSPEDRDWLNKILEGEKEAGIKVDGRKRDSHVLLINILKGLFDMGKTVAVEHVDTSLTEDLTTQAVNDSSPIPGLSTQANDNPIPGSSGNQNNKKVSTKSGSLDTHENINKKKFENAKLCKFYNRGKCTKGKNCNFEHPTICKAYRIHGLKKTNEKGCDGSCDQLHPNTCRDSLKNKTCTRSDCRFFHLKGTKSTQGNHVSKTSNQSQQSPPSREYQGYQNKFNQTQKVETQNRFSPLMDPPTWTQSSNQVFHGGSPNLTDTLAAIMKQLGDINQWQINLQQRIQSSNTQSQSSQNPWTI